MSNYFKNDEYWKKHINDKLESDMWIDEYVEYLKSPGKCLELGCGRGQYSKRLMEYGFDVVSTDISDIALNEVKKFNNNVLNVDMSKELPFGDSEFNIIFASLSIHYFDNFTTKKLISEINRILKVGGFFIGSVNGMEGLNVIKDTAIELEHHFYLNNSKNIRLFDQDDLNKYLSVFEIKKIDKRKTTRFENEKSYYVFIVEKKRIIR